MPSFTSAKSSLLFLFFALLCLFVQADRVAADAGDVIAGLLGTFISLIFVCAVLGWWSRRGQAQQPSSEGETA